MIEKARPLYILDKEQPISIGNNRLIFVISQAFNKCELKNLIEVGAILEGAAGIEGNTKDWKIKH